ncbi:MAG: hypothetical protein RL616_2217, partial [Verrucomicrobiota bacterium]
VRASFQDLSQMEIAVDADFAPVIFPGSCQCCFQLFQLRQQDAKRFQLFGIAIIPIV